MQCCSCFWAWCSLDEDKIFERILADNWEAKDKLVTQVFLHYRHVITSMLN